MIDCHLHLDHFPEPEKVVKESELEAYITTLFEEKKEKTISISEKFDNVYYSLGYEPLLIRKMPEILEEAGKLAPVAIGEVGFDFCKEENRSLQKKAFEKASEIAKELDIPVITHSRSAGHYVIDFLKKRGVERVMMHAFDGKAKYAENCDFLFSIPPSIARSRQKQKLVKRLPIEKILLESDAPSLGPVKGEENHPKNVKVSLEWIAKLKEIEPSEVEKITSKTARDFFRL